MTLVNLETIQQPFKWEQANKYIKENNEIIIDKKLHLLIFNLKVPVSAEVVDDVQKVTYEDKVVFKDYVTGEMIYNPPYTLFTEDDLEIAVFDTNLKLIADYTTLGGEA